MTGEVEFDHIAPVYDETRRAPSEEELRALTELLYGCRTILDAGVGTGRFSVPLAARGFEPVGADLSREMMRRARTKGIARLVRADLRHLPFPDRVVDAAFMAHVLQLLADPGPVLRELGRVARQRVVVVVPDWAERRGWEDGLDRRTRYRELAAELGYTLPARGIRYRHTLEDLSAIAPPKAIEVVPRSPVVGLTPEERRARWGAWLYGGAGVPPEVHAEILCRLEAERPIEPTTSGRPRMERFVAWDPADLATTG